MIATMLPTSATPECMSASECARFLGLNRKTVYEYAARNVIPHRRLGRRMLFSRTQLMAWLAPWQVSSGKAS